jgi:hypothetical protein
MLKLPTRLAACATVLTILMLTAGLADEFDPTVTFDLTIGPPPATTSFDISFVKNDIGAYILADRKNNAVDLFDASKLTFLGGIGSGGFVGPSPATPSVALQFSQTAAEQRVKRGSHARRFEPRQPI